MSEYQYYEFAAIDRPLTRAEMAELRDLSTRAEITSAGLVNHYEQGVRPRIAASARSPCHTWRVAAPTDRSGSHADMKHAPWTAQHRRYPLEYRLIKWNRPCLCGFACFSWTHILSHDSPGILLG